MRIEVATDQHEGAEFVAWACRHGHDAVLGSGTGSYIDGIETATDLDASEIMRALWNAYAADTPPTSPYLVAGVGYDWLADAEEAATRLGTCILYRHSRRDGGVVYVSIPESER